MDVNKKNIAEFGMCETVLDQFLVFNLFYNFCVFPVEIFLQRNRSLTKEELAEFWRSKKIEENELLFVKASYRPSKEDQVCVHHTHSF